jgi:uncharacterized protein YkwD
MAFAICHECAVERRKLMLDRRRVIPGILVVMAWLAVPANGFGQRVEEDESEAVQMPQQRASDKRRPDLARVTEIIIQQTNAFRQEQGRGKVTASPKLGGAAQYFARYMARTGKYGHTADGNRPADRAKKFGYEYCIVAENIAYEFNSAGFTTEELGKRFFEAWKHSSGHRKNMLDPDVGETGVAVAQSEKTGYYYAVQMFGRPKSQAIAFQVANESDATVSYEIGDRNFSLPPRYTCTRQLCRPADLTFELPRASAGRDRAAGKVRPTGGEHFVITTDAEGYRVKEE